ncbi:MAG TPA: 2Fe-2S iron-sulfur cluster-binding protein [Gemmatimonadales bacterium]|nr:2Fe-2S iron-sulfur cluster-binding protein [Gemmatimonadales bacterium]
MSRLPLPGTARRHTDAPDRERPWLEEDVAQCGYCQPGQLMAAAALLADHPRPTDPQIDAAMTGNLCRCGTRSAPRTWKPEGRRSRSRGGAPGGAGPHSHSP